MRVARQLLQLRTSSEIEFVDISDRVRAWVDAQGLRDGQLTVISPHTTARIVINERDEALQRDMRRHLERFVPKAAAYEHNERTVDGRDNAHAHLAALFMPAGETIPLVDGRLQLGQWQALFFVELDGPRAAREVQLHLIGA